MPATPAWGILSFMVSHIDIAAIPAEALSIPSDCYVVIDCIRATTTVATLFARGMESLLVTDDLELARFRAAAEDRLLLGEVGGLPPDDFDYGNSPAAASTLALAGTRGVLYTTNGTTALCVLAGNGAAVIAGALANISAVSAAVKPFGTVTLVCAGGGGGVRFGLDDFAAAAEFVHVIRRESPDAEPGDLALLASRLEAVDSLVLESHHAGVIRRLGLEDDLAFCIRRDSSDAVPVVTSHGKGWALLEARA